MSEKDIQTGIMLALGQFSNVRTFRNNVGTGICGRPIRIAKTQTVTLNAGDWVVKNGRPVNFGLAKGSPDLCGWETITITAEMVGQKIARILFIEVKDGTGLSTEQQTFIKLARSMSVKVVVARSPEEAVSGVVTGELGL